MLELVQTSSMLIGSYEAAKELSQKDKADLLVISDSHGGFHNLLSVVEHFGPQCDGLVFCGDGMEDIGRLLDRAASTPELMDALPPVLACVKGNNDVETYFFQSMAVQVPRDLVFEAARHRIFMTHGHHYKLYTGSSFLWEKAKSCKANITFYGHSHIACVTAKRRSVLILNPGSCSLPRGGQPRCFAVVHLEAKKSAPSWTFYSLSEEGGDPYDGYAREKI